MGILKKSGVSSNEFTDFLDRFVPEDVVLRLTERQVSLPEAMAAFSGHPRIACTRVGFLLLALVLEIAGVDAPLGAGIRPDQVAVLVNPNVPASERVAATYRKLRAIPEDNVLRLPMGIHRRVPRKYFIERIAEPVAKWLRERPGITTLLTTYGVPYSVEAVKDAPESDAAVDNELAACLFPTAVEPARWAANPLFLRGTDPPGLVDPRSRDMVFVARLDAPTPEIAERMVEDAVAVEKEGLEGGAFVDSRGIPGSAGYGMGDTILRGSHDLLAGAGFPATLDESGESWKAGPSGRSAIAEGAAYYGGWYQHRTFQDIFGEKGLARGAIAWHLASSEAVDLWSPEEKGWAANLLRRGAAATWGPVREPYVSAFPHADILVEMLLEGAPLAEAYWRSLPQVSWAMVLLGDPLYRPFAVPRPAVAAGPYRVDGPAGGGPLTGRKTSIAVRLRAVGPPGSSLPALRGKVRSISGLASAGGEVRVEPLEAGRTARVVIPEAAVQASPGSRFRLALDLEDPAGKKRTVVLDGISGLARLRPPGRGSRLLAVDPSGRLVLAGPRDAPAIIRLPDLEERPFAIPSTARILGGEFSPDSKFLALRCALPGGRHDAAQFRSAIVDLETKAEITVPGGLLFSDWLSSKKALLVRGMGVPADPGNLFLLDVTAGKTEAVEIPEGWKGKPIGEGGPLVLVGPRGEVGFRKPGEAPVEVLRGKGPFRTWAVADDLSSFSAVDASGKVWVQRAAGAEPEEVGEAPGGKVFWGPVSRRFAWTDRDGKGRVQDCPIGKTFDIGPLDRGFWSSDETRFVFASGEAGGSRLKAWTAEGVKDLFPVQALGAWMGAALTPDGKRVFLLASPGLDLDVWELRAEG
jgi:uncharacterized protein (TIGR03790 family)